MVELEKKGIVTMADTSQPMISAFTGLLAAGLAALGMNNRLNRIERGVLFKDTFREFKEANSNTLGRIEKKTDKLEVLLHQIHRDMPKREGET